MTPPPFFVEGADRPAQWVITCDHASNRVPAEINEGSLGLPTADMQRHIAYDIGAAGVSRALGQALDAPVVLSNFSRLVIDPNRGEDDPTLLMKLYDGTIIPANRHAGDTERERRLAAYHRPYHQALASVIASRKTPLIVAIHSFTPRLNGRAPRPWHIGLLFADDTRLAHPLLRRMQAEPDLCVGENEPYGGHLPGDAVDQHALRPGHANVLIELRHDLITTKAQQQEWGARLAPMLKDALATANL